MHLLYTNYLVYGLLHISQSSSPTIVLLAFCKQLKDKIPGVLVVFRHTLIDYKVNSRTFHSSVILWGKNGVTP